MTNEESRAAAERAYTLAAQEYIRAPIGSRDWCIFWQGWKAAMEARPARSEPEPSR